MDKNEEKKSYQGMFGEKLCSFCRHYFKVLNSSFSDSASKPKRPFNLMFSSIIFHEIRLPIFVEHDFSLVVLFVFHSVFPFFLYFSFFVALSLLFFPFVPLTFSTWLPWFTTDMFNVLKHTEINNPNVSTQKRSK